ncbi:MAG: hypothetical protein ACRDIY_13115 [Chloroflexota bacterium]
MTVKIPIHGSASSLNVASATSVLLYEMDRQRRAADDWRGQRRISDGEGARG